MPGPPSCSNSGIEEAVGTVGAGVRRGRVLIGADRPLSRPVARRLLHLGARRRVGPATPGGAVAGQLASEHHRFPLSICFSDTKPAATFTEIHLDAFFGDEDFHNPPGRLFAADGGPHSITHFGQFLADLAIRIILELQAALEPTALAGQFGRIEGQPLVFRHADGDGLKLAQPAGAAQFPAAQPDAAELFRLIAHADLAQLDANAELAGQIAHQLAKVHPGLRGEEERQPVAVKRVLGIDQPHGQASCGDAFLRDLLRGPLYLRRLASSWS